MKAIDKVVLVWEVNRFLSFRDKMLVTLACIGIAVSGIMLAAVYLAVVVGIPAALIYAIIRAVGGI
jgi:hypothetical protein